MASWHNLSVYVSAVLLVLPRAAVPAAVNTDDVLMQQRRSLASLSPPDASTHSQSLPENDVPLHPEKINIENESPLHDLVLDASREKKRVVSEYLTGQRHNPELRVLQDNNFVDNVSLKLSDASVPSLLFKPLKSLLSTDGRLSAKNGMPPIIKKTIVKQVDEYSTSSHNEQTTEKKRQNIGETSDSLIKRLCAVHKSRKEKCYQEGSSICYCTGGLADCSGKKRAPNLSYAPKFLPNITCLKFENNNVNHLDDSYFSNVSSFVAIDFSSNSLATISAQTFARFTNLKYLILNNNVFGYKHLRMVLDYPPSLRLDIVSLYLPDVQPNYFKEYSSIPTSQIYMDFSNFNNLDLREFAHLENLEYLSVANSSIQRVISALVPKLKELDLSYNNISTFPITCESSMKKHVLDSRALYLNHYIFQPQKTSEEISEHMKINGEEHGELSLFPDMISLNIAYNIILTLPPRDEICLPRLRNLNLESNNITEIPESAFTSLKSIKVLILDKMTSGIAKIGSSAFNIPTLTTLYLSKNGIPFNSKDISTKLFQGCSNVKVLSIDHNQLSGVSEDMFEELLNHTPVLKYIYLGSTNMQIIPVKAFSQLKKLEKLFIYVNHIKEIPPQAFDNMPSLRYLYMDENQISTIKEASFSLKTRHRLKEINLSKNVFLCDCNLLWFQSWLREAGPRQFMTFNNYLCSNINNVSVQNYKLSRQACLFSREVYILFVVCLSIFLVCFLVFAVIYRYRWIIRLMMYERRAPIKNARNIPRQNDYRYDLFVVYSNDDCEWVDELLIPVLEKKWRLHACIHQRDFIAGGYIVDNIVESMNASRRILVVVSSRFAHSKWCNFELQLCQSHVITHDLPSLMVIILDEIESRDMSAAMYALYHTTCFLEWPTCSSDSVEIDTFWRRLETSLGTLIDARSQATSVKSVEK